MAQRKGLISRLIMGRDDQPDFTPNKLPGSRWAVFKDVFSNRIGAMAKISLLSLLFIIPALVWLFMMYVIKQADSTMIPYSANLGLGYPVVTDAIVVGQVRTLSYNMQLYSVLVPLIALAGVGLAGAFETMKMLAWGEGVPVATTFFRGIKKNWFPFFCIFLFVGVSLLVLMLSISVYQYVPTLNKALRIVMITLSVIQFVVMLCMTLFLSTQAVTYKLGFFGLVKNSFLFSIALFPQTLFFVVLSFLPLVILLMIPITISLFLWLVFLIIGIAYIVLVWTVYAHWVYDKFVNDHVKGAVKNRGMYVPTEEETKKAEIERIRTRATKYGAAYASMRLSSLDEGKSFTPLEANFSRADLIRLNDEKTEMIDEINTEIDEINAQLEEEARAYEEEQAAKKKHRKGYKAKKKTGGSETEIATMPITDEEYKED